MHDLMMEIRNSNHQLISVSEQIAKSLSGIENAITQQQALAKRIQRFALIPMVLALLLPLLLVLVFFAFRGSFLDLLLGTKGKRGPGPDSLIGKPFPEFRMTDIRDNPVTSESLKGKVLVVDFWASWCGPSKAVSPIMQTVHKKFAESELVVIGANAWERDDEGVPVKSKDNAAEYAQKKRYTYLMTYGNDALAQQCRVQVVPTIFVVDKQGIVKQVFVGSDPDLQSKLEEVIEPLLDIKKAN
jgi:thiol-disulfide isomerase/thioredoxin